VLSLLVLTGFASADGAPVAGPQEVHNTLSDAERDAGWRLLFDGETLEGWRSYYSDEIPEGWRAQNGMLERFDGGGDIMTVSEFTNFELTLDWRLEAGGNSGIFYLAATGSDNIFMIAPEMQVLDDAVHPDGRDPLTSAGANYGLHPAPRGVVRPAGEWNHIRIKVEDEHVEHWLNGQKIVEYVIGSPEWTELVANSKFAQWPEYGTARTGHIGLQDHGDPVWYRNIKIREIG
jgi:3-keto-disaccharide hydrolase